MKYAVLEVVDFENGRVYIAPANLKDTKDAANQDAEWRAEAYNRDQIILELRPVRTVKGKKPRGR